VIEKARQNARRARVAFAVAGADLDAPRLKTVPSALE
jgi:hypothetical protein